MTNHPNRSQVVTPVTAPLYGHEIQAYEHAGTTYAFFRARFDDRPRWHYLDGTGLPITHGWHATTAPIAVRRFAGFPASPVRKPDLNADLHKYPR